MDLGLSRRRGDAYFGINKSRGVKVAGRRRILKTKSRRLATVYFARYIYPLFYLVCYIYIYDIVIKLCRLDCDIIKHA